MRLASAKHQLQLASWKKRYRKRLLRKSTIKLWKSQLVQRKRWRLMSLNLWNGHNKLPLTQSSPKAKTSTRTPLQNRVAKYLELRTVVTLIRNQATTRKEKGGADWSEKKNLKLRKSFRSKDSNKALSRLKCWISSLDTKTSQKLKRALLQRSLTRGSLQQLLIWMNTP